MKLSETAGHTIVKCDMPQNFDDACEAQDIVINAETASFHDAYFDQKHNQFCSELVDIIDKGHSCSAVRYLKVQDLRNKFKLQCKELFNDFDPIIIPSTLSTAPLGLDSTGSPKLNKPFTNAGLPTLAIPNRISNQTGLPTGLQIVANYNRQQDLIDIGEQFRKMSDFHLNFPKLTEKQYVGSI